MTYKTLQDIFDERSQSQWADLPYIHYKTYRDRPYQSLSFGGFTSRTNAIAAALQSEGIQSGDRILITSESRPEWMITDFAAVLIGAISVPVFPTLTAKQTHYILDHSGAKVAVISSEYQLRKIIGGIESAFELKLVIVLNSEVILPTHDRVKFVRFDSLEVTFAGKSANRANIVEDDIATIIYTSGTTGEPKGVMLTHRNIVSNIKAATAAIPRLAPEDMFLSFLPLSHAFERIASYLTYCSGVQVAYAESIDAVAQNMLEIRPTFMTAVPRFFERVYSRILIARDEMSPNRRRLFDWSVRVGEAHSAILEGKSVSFATRLLFPIANTFVLSKIRAKTGGRLRFLISGGAALKPELGRAFAAFGLTILEGYGLTETSPVAAVSQIKKIRWGTVGPPIDGVEFRIADDGEVLIRGANIMRGYYRDEQATTEMIDADGWLHSGDIGVLDDEGRLQITDRKKHLIILANGKNIAPSRIESLLESSELIDQAIVFGEGRDFLSALIVPTGRTDQDDTETRRTIELQITTINRELASYEKVRRFEIVRESFSIENAMMTPTLKIRRKEVAKRFADVINSMYGNQRSF